MLHQNTSTRGSTRALIKTSGWTFEIEYATSLCTQFTNFGMNQMPRTALLLVNPKSRQGSSSDLQDGIDLLEKSGVHVILRLTESVEHAKKLIDEYRQEIQLVIIAGGDGTISRLIDRIYEQQVLLAVLPLGTANDFSRSLNMPPDLQEAFQAIATCRRARINLGKANGEYFLNVAHVGLGVTVARSLTAEVKRRWGVLSYFKALVEAFNKSHSFRVRIWANGHEYSLRTIQLAVGNGRFYGGGNIIDDESSLFDGELSLYAVKPQRLWELLLLLPFLRSGKRQLNAQIFCCRSQKIRIETEQAYEIQADGEPLTKMPVDFDVIPRALEVITGEPGADADAPVPMGVHETTDNIHEHDQN